MSHCEHEPFRASHVQGSLPLSSGIHLKFNFISIVPCYVAPSWFKLELCVWSVIHTSMISSISTLVILPSPSRSYMLKAQLSFCSKLPRDVMDKAQMNSRKSMVPSPFLSKVLNACCANFEASPYGKNCKREKQWKEREMFKICSQKKRIVVTEHISEVIIKYNLSRSSCWVRTNSLNFSSLCSICVCYNMTTCCMFAINSCLFIVWSGVND